MVDFGACGSLVFRSAGLADPPPARPMRFSCSYQPGRTQRFLSRRLYERWLTAWIRLDDQIAHHPKMTRVSPEACWLYVTGLGFCQKFLTDGFIPKTSISTLSHVKDLDRCITELVDAGLWNKRANGSDGFQVHDYLDFNESAKTVKERRRADAVRKMSGRNPDGIQPDSRRNPAGVLARARASHPIPSVPILKEQEQELKPAPPPDNGHTVNGRSKRPIFSGQKLTVFEWMLDECMKTLGSFTEQFDLHSWFFELDSQAMTANLVIPKRDGGVWLHEQLLAEIRRRGLPITVATSKPGSASETEIAAIMAEIRRQDEATRR